MLTTTSKDATVSEKSVRTFSGARYVCVAFKLAKPSSIQSLFNSVCLIVFVYYAYKQQTAKGLTIYVEKCAL